MIVLGGLGKPGLEGKSWPERAQSAETKPRFCGLRSGAELRAVAVIL